MVNGCFSNITASQVLPSPINESMASNMSKMTLEVIIKRLRRQNSGPSDDDACLGSNQQNAMLLNLQNDYSSQRYNEAYQRLVKNLENIEAKGKAREVKNYLDADLEDLQEMSKMSLDEDEKVRSMDRIPTPQLGVQKQDSSD